MGPWGNGEDRASGIQEPPRGPRLRWPLELGRDASSTARKPQARRGVESTLVIALPRCVVDCRRSLSGKFDCGEVNVEAVQPIELSWWCRTTCPVKITFGGDLDENIERKLKLSAMR